FLFFFFSSRRRHTRFSRDWSSDVCSSDLFGFCVSSGLHLGLGKSKLIGEWCISCNEDPLTCGRVRTKMYAIFLSIQSPRNLVFLSSGAKSNPIGTFLECALPGGQEIGLFRFFCFFNAI